MGYYTPSSSSSSSSSSSFSSSSSPPSSPSPTIELLPLTPPSKLMRESLCAATTCNVIDLTGDLDDAGDLDDKVIDLTADEE